MIRTAFAVLAIGNLVVHAMPAHAQAGRGDVAYATLSMACGPNPPNSYGNIIVYATGAQVVPAGTLVTITYKAPISTRTWFGTFLSWEERTTVCRTRHTMISYDPEGTGVTGYCLSATYTSNKPVLAW